MLQTQSQLASSYVAVSSTARAPVLQHTATEGHSPWLFALASLSFALTLASVIYLSAISF